MKCCIDVGGTFTDCLILDEEGNLQAFKTPTVPADPASGMIQVFKKAAEFYRESEKELLSKVAFMIAHGTTLSTNALITGSGAKVGLVTSEGFRDITEMRRGYKNIRTSRYNLFVPPYRPLVPRDLRFGVKERTLYSGEIITPLDEEGLREAVKKLKAEGIEALAICFLHSYANPENERRAEAICRQEMPGAFITTSHDVLPVFREYERFSTTVVSAYVGPITEKYLIRLGHLLEGLSFKGKLFLVQAGATVQSVAECIRRPVYLIGSGPAAAPAGALLWGGTIGNNNLISIDMGGTSLDICLISNGETPTTQESWVEDERIAIKMVDVHSAGAGGGSIAWIDSLGLLRVGPKSAGADPGPACYNRGGSEPTVTDADLLLGYIPADYFLGGEIALRKELAEEAVKRVASPLGLSTSEAARAIFTTVNSYMADQITEVSTKRGFDIRDFVLVVGGGAGPVHAAYLAESLGITTVLIPRFASTFSAFGMLNMAIGRDFARSYIAPAEAADLETINRLYGEMEREAFELLTSLGVRGEEIVLSRSAEMRYEGQFHEVEVKEVPLGKIGKEQLPAVINAFHRRHEELFTFAMPFRGVEFLNLRLLATARREELKLKEIPRGKGDASHALKRKRPCLFPREEGFLDTPVYEGGKLAAGDRFDGPAIVEETTTTVVVPKSFRCTVDRYQSYILTRRQQP